MLASWKAVSTTSKARKADRRRGTVVRVATLNELHQKTMKNIDKGMSQRTL